MRPIQRKALLIALFVAPSWSSLSAVPMDSGSTVLTIKIENVSNKGGDVRIALYDRAGYSGHDQKPILATAVEARAPETVVTLPNVPRGVYAIKMFQDFNRSGSFVTNRLGIPEEPFGFSNDALPLLDQPSFDEAKFSLENGSTRIVVHLRASF